MHGSPSGCYFQFTGKATGMQLSGILNPAQVLPKSVFFATMVGAGGGEVNPIILGFLYNMLYLKFEAVPFLPLLSQERGNSVNFPLSGCFSLQVPVDG